jgi:hypothetical protein
MKVDIMKKRDTALSELAKTYEVVRDELTERMEDLAGRIDDIDARRLGGRAYSSARDLRSKVEARVDRSLRNSPVPVRRQRRRFPWALLAVGFATAGLAWLLYDRRRRDMIQGRITQLGVRAQEQVGPGMKNGVTGAVDSVMGKVKGGRGLDEEALKNDVQTAIAAGGGLPDGLQVAIEGRTVYLRGVADSAVSDRAAARAQQVDGVAAVVNLTTVPATPAANSGTASTGRRA